MSHTHWPHAGAGPVVCEVARGMKAIKVTNVKSILNSIVNGGSKTSLVFLLVQRVAFIQAARTSLLLSRRHTCPPALCFARELYLSLIVF